MPLAVVDQTRADGVMLCATTGTELSASFVALAFARAQLAVAIEISGKRDAATAVMRDLIHPPES
jgi:hypothetical protein